MGDASVSTTRRRAEILAVSTVRPQSKARPEAERAALRDTVEPARSLPELRTPPVAATARPLALSFQGVSTDALLLDAPGVLDALIRQRGYPAAEALVAEVRAYGQEGQPSLAAGVREDIGGVPGVLLARVEEAWATRSPDRAVAAFQSRAVELTQAALQISAARVESESRRYGDLAAGALFGPEAERLVEGAQAIAAHQAATDARLAPLRTAQAELEVYDPNTDASSVPPQSQARYEALEAEIQGLEGQHQAYRATWVRELPVLGAIEDRADLASLAAGPSKEAAQVVRTGIDAVRKGVAQTQAALKADPTLIWSFPPAIEAARTALDVGPGSPTGALVEEKQAAIARHQIFGEVCFAAVSLGVGLVAAIPTGGGSLWVAGGLLALNHGLTFQRDYQRYQRSDAAYHSSFEVEGRLSPEPADPSALVFDGVAAVFDGAMIGRGLRGLAELGPLQQSLAAARSGQLGGAVEALAKGVGRLEASEVKAVEELVRLAQAGDRAGQTALRTRLVAELGPERAAQAELLGLRASGALGFKVDAALAQMDPQTLLRLVDALGPRLGAELERHGVEALAALGRSLSAAQTGRVLEAFAEGGGLKALLEQVDPKRLSQLVESVGAKPMRALLKRLTPEGLGRLTELLGDGGATQVLRARLSPEALDTLRQTLAAPELRAALALGQPTQVTALLAGGINAKSLARACHNINALALSRLPAPAAADLQARAARIAPDLVDYLSKLKGGIVAADRELRFAEEAITVDLRDDTHMVLRHGAQLSEAAIVERTAVGTLPYEAGGFGAGKVTKFKSFEACMTSRAEGLTTAAEEARVDFAKPPPPSMASKVEAARQAAIANGKTAFEVKLNEKGFTTDMPQAVGEGRATVAGSQQKIDAISRVRTKVSYRAPVDHPDQGKWFVPQHHPDLKDFDLSARTYTEDAHRVVPGGSR